MENEDGLVAVVLTARRSGKSYLEIQSLYNIPAARAEDIERHYFESKAAIDPYRMRLLQLERLESLIGVLTDMAMMGNIKSAEVLLKLLDQINVLLGLNLETQKLEIKIVTEQQSAVVFELIDRVQAKMLDRVQTLLAGKPELAAIEDGWEEYVAKVYDNAVEEVIDAELVR